MLLLSAAVIQGVTASAEQLLYAGLKAMQRHDVEQAKQLFARAIQASPGESMHAHMNLGSIHTHEGRHDQATRHFLAAVALEPGDASVRIELGKALDASGDKLSAGSHFQSAVTLQPTKPESHFHLGSSLAQPGYWPGSLGANPYDAVTHLSLSLKLQHPDEPLVRLSLGEALKKTGNITQAIRQFQHVEYVSREAASRENALEARSSSDSTARRAVFYQLLSAASLSRELVAVGQPIRALLTALRATQLPVKQHEKLPYCWLYIGLAADALMRSKIASANARERRVQSSEKQAGEREECEWTSTLLATRGGVEGGTGGSLTTAEALELKRLILDAAVEGLRDPMVSAAAVAGAEAAEAVEEAAGGAAAQLSAAGRHVVLSLSCVVSVALRRAVASAQMGGHRTSSQALLEIKASSTPYVRRVSYQLGQRTRQQKVSPLSPRVSLVSHTNTQAEQMGGGANGAGAAGEQGVNPQTQRNNAQTQDQGVNNKLDFHVASVTAHLQALEGLLVGPSAGAAAFAAALAAVKERWVALVALQQEQGGQGGQRGQARTDGGGWNFIDYLSMEDTPAAHDCDISNCSGDAHPVADNQVDRISALDITEAQFLDRYSGLAAPVVITGLLAHKQVTHQGGDQGHSAHAQATEQEWPAWKLLTRGALLERARSAAGGGAASVTLERSSRSQEHRYAPHTDGLGSSSADESAVDDSMLKERTKMPLEQYIQRHVPVKYGESGIGQAQPQHDEQDPLYQHDEQDPLYLFRAGQLPGSFGDFFRHPRLFSGINATTSSASARNTSATKTPHTPTRSRFSFDTKRREKGSLFYVGPTNSGAYFHIHTCAW
jgi:Tfp pilus assembly protein PilF